MRQSSFVSAVILAVFFCACAQGPQGGLNSLNTARASLDRNVVTVRWFPVPGATGYRIYVPGSNVPTAVPATACTPAAPAFRSGTCVHEMTIPGGVRPGVRISAFNVHGESQPVLATVGAGE